MLLLSLVVANRPFSMPEAQFPGATCLCFSRGFVAAPRKTAAVYEEEEGIKSGY